MIDRPVPGTAAALALVVAMSAGLAIAAALGFGQPFDGVLQILVQVTLPGFAALAGAVFWRLHTRAGRPSWAFIFTASGLLNVAIWAILVLFLTFDEPSPDAGIEVTTLFPYIAMCTALVWAICGGIFSWLQARAAPGEKLP